MFNPKSSKAEEFISHKKFSKRFGMLKRTRIMLILLTVLLKRRNFAKGFPTGKLRSCLPAGFPIKMKSSLNLQGR